mmetsp:Transcript_49355/g.119700  ORF Transcript_49355/g.119700 Transcript_49355/m.119700 type:complete len:891 (+) Transcript_49355:617-3289(+)
MKLSLAAKTIEIVLIAACSSWTFCNAQRELQPQPKAEVRELANVSGPGPVLAEAAVNNDTDELQRLRGTKEKSLLSQQEESTEKKDDFHRYDILQQWDITPKSISDLMKGNDVGRNQDEDSDQTTNQQDGPLVRRVQTLEVKTCDGGVVGRQYIVECKHFEEEKCHDELELHGVVIINDLPESDFFVVCVDTPEEKQKLLQLATVVDLEEDPIRTLSYMSDMIRPYYPPTTNNDENGDRRLAQSVPYGVSLIDADSFWTAKNNKGSGAKVCIIDTGIRDDHEDFAGSTISGSSNSRTVVTPYNVDQNGHGTHVAGTVAAKDNGTGIVGVAPDAELYIVRVFSGQNAVFTASSLTAAMEECKRGGVDVVNMSLGGASSSTFERNKINQLVNQGIHVVAASGNSGNGANPVEYPASYDTVISVGAVDRNEEIAGFSTHNSQVDVSAPGVDIQGPTSQSRSSYAYYSGTSMASPHVAGAVALLVSKYPNKSRSEIRQALESTAKDFGVCGPDRLFGNGLVNVLDAAEYLEGTGSEAPEQSGCVNTKVTVRPDKWGSENSYLITNPSGDVVYKNGPYPNNRQIEWVDEIDLPTLPNGQCYQFEMLDSFGDGMCCENGNGYFKVEYNGEQELADESFLDGGSRSGSFGCGDSNPSPTSSPTPPPVPSPTNSPTSPPSSVSVPTVPPTPSPTPPPAVCGNGIVEDGEECDRGTDNDDNGMCTAQCKNARCGDGFLQSEIGEECDDGNSNQGDGCSNDCKFETITTSCPGSGQAQVELYLQADSYSYSENELYFFEKKNNGNGNDNGNGNGADSDEFIWIGTKRGIRNNREYDLTECVDSSKCYQFYFFDNYGDGLFSDGLRLRWNNVDELIIQRDEVGELWRGGPAVYWMHEIGNC